MTEQQLAYAAIFGLPPLALLAFAFLTTRKVQKGAERIDRMKADLKAKRQAAAPERRAATG